MSVWAIWGEEKTGKTTLALTFPKPIMHFDLDIGGYQRAARRLDTSNITSTPYTPGLQLEKMIGAQKDGISVRVPKKVTGYKEMWSKICIDFSNAVQDASIQTIVMDSGTQLWSICHTALLQEKQEQQLSQGIKESDLRTSLLSIEYGPANERMKLLIFTARSFNKNLILTHYPKDVYGSRLTDKGVEEYRTGEVDIDGFKQTKALSDIAVRTYADKGKEGVKTKAVVTLSGMGLEAIGLELENPTYDRLQKMIDAVTGAGK